MIGIVGGVGPLAGIDIVRKIIEETKANKDQDHIPVLLSSQPHRIADRTNFLLGKEKTNPAIALSEIILELERSGAILAAIPCNTAHAPQIFNRILEILKDKKSSIQLLHLIEETANYISNKYPGAKVGVLSTTGTRNTGLYKNALLNQNLEVIEPDDELQSRIHEAIYDTSFGIKASPSVITTEVKETLHLAMETLKNKGAEVIILGCTELPLAIHEKEYLNMIIIDPNQLLARALIDKIDPTKLK